ncbi:hypothetical protein [Bradyrhizobium hipponense]|uniref:hypothetical protein n=1 Tax=Bradyrhizobium hipponense TaxID=2605638 RepID=UPI001F3E3C1C|nr:hypothetical protein [Bradyrhizobium hipponense]
MRRVSGINVQRTFGELASNSLAVVSRVLAPFVARVIVRNPLQVKAIAQAHVKADKIDAGTFTSRRGEVPTMNLDA